ncbi:MAG: NusG domain II-containing protein [Methylophilaceae bacterium]|nr:NusG domain II-containing protein [Methylophilaceae bacterium]
MIIIGIIAVVILFNTLWLGEAASKVQIRAGSQIFSTLSLNQQRTLDVPGPLGMTVVAIDNGKVRVVSDPSPRQYCVKQGWLEQAGQVAMCLPNQVSVELLGSKKLYDSLNY